MKVRLKQVDNNSNNWLQPVALFHIVFHTVKPFDFMKLSPVVTNLAPF